jgi:hypothetical protein
MKRALHFLVTRVMRSRTGIALALAVLVLGVVGTTRVLSGPADNPGVRPPAQPLVPSSPMPPEDGLVSPEATVSPTVVPGAQTPETVAGAFAADWVARHVPADVWHARLAERATPELARKLSGVDPAAVPAERVTGQPVLIPHAATIVDVVIPVDSGKLRLRVIAADDRWLVDGVDWERQ